MRNCERPIQSGELSKISCPPERTECPTNSAITRKAPASAQGTGAKCKMRHRGKPLRQSSSIPLFLENHLRSAYLMDLKRNIDFDAVGYLDEWNPAVHAKFLAVKSHAALNLAVARSLFRGVKC